MKYCPKCQRAYAVIYSVCQDDGEPLLLKDLYGLTGRIINEKYRIESLVAIGGMSALYRARQIGVERRVAFKILLPNLAVHDSNMLNLFEREARTAGRLTHENIATVHDAGRTPDELAFIVMEWLEGKTLEDEFHEKGALSYKRILHLTRQIAAALDAAHAQGVIHRDLKPANIMIVPRERRGVREEERDLVKVLDFGLAKISSESTDLQVSSALGTPHYASPEQFRIGEEIDGRSDIYSFGIILYRMLTGYLPFDANSVHELIRLHLLETPPPLRQLRPEAPLELEHLINRMLTKTPHYRPATATEAVEALEQILLKQATSGEMLSATSGNYVQTTSGNYLTQPQAQPAVVGQPGLTPRSGAMTGQISSGQMPSQMPGQATGTNLGAMAASSSGSITPTATSGSITPPQPAPAVAQTFVSFNNAAGKVATTAALNPVANHPGQPNTGTTFSPTSRLAVFQPVNGAFPAEEAAPPVAFYRQPKVLVAVCALILLLGSAAYFFFSKNGAEASDKDTILLGDLINTTGEEVFDQALKPALAAQLGQATTLKLLPEEKMRAMLAFMKRPANTPITRELARELALRSTLKAAIVGQIDKLDRNYSVTLEAINSQTGETIARSMAEAQGKDNVLKALGQVAGKLRENLGTTLAAVPKSGISLHVATTASLEALKTYSLGYEQFYVKGNLLEAVPYLQRASELDPQFALPQQVLGTLYASSGLPRQSTEAAQRAYQLREHVSERERLSIEGLYHATITGAANKVIETYQLMTQTFPDSSLAQAELANAYERTGQLNAALSAAEAARQTDESAAYAHLVYANTLLRLNRFSEAQASLEAALARQIDSIALRGVRFQLAVLQKNGEQLKQQIDWARAHQQELRALDWEAQIAVSNGSLKTATGYWRQAIEQSKQKGQKELAAGFAMNAAVRLALAGQKPEAEKLLDEALALSHDSFVRLPLASPLPAGPFTYALAGAPAKAQTISDELLKNQPQNFLATALWLPLTKAVLAVQANQPEQALEALKSTTNYETSTQHFANWVRGQAFLQLKRGPAAVAEFQKILEQRGQDTTLMLYPLAHLGMARALALTNENVKSRRYYKDFLELWQGADANLPMLAEARKEQAAL